MRAKHYYSLADCPLFMSSGNIQISTANELQTTSLRALGATAGSQCLLRCRFIADDNRNEREKLMSVEQAVEAASCSAPVRKNQEEKNSRAVTASSSAARNQSTTATDTDEEDVRSDLRKRFNIRVLERPAGHTQELQEV